MPPTVTQRRSWELPLPIATIQCLNQPTGVAMFASPATHDAVVSTARVVQDSRFSMIHTCAVCPYVCTFEKAAGCLPLNNQQLQDHHCQ